MKGHKKSNILQLVYIIRVYIVQGKILLSYKFLINEESL